MTMTSTPFSGLLISTPTPQETLDLWRESQELGPELGPTPFEEYFQAYLDGTFFTCDRRIAEATPTGGEIYRYETIGWAVATNLVYDSYAWLSHLYVSESYRRQGIASQLMGKIEARFPAVALGVQETNLPAVNFYTLRGYQYVTCYRSRGDVWLILASPGGRESELRYVFG